MSDKKRTTYKRGSKLDLPSHIDKTKFGYRWLNAEKLAAATDGYEERGFVIDTDGGTPVRRGDLVLGKMPIDMHNAMKQEKEDARKGQIEFLLQKQADDAERETFEFRKKGGKVKFEFSQE